ncbi:helix-turn-helix domain-containing protein [Carnobacterium alterfunditum]|uniref:helix-turn-helix domain-containing protein n=1 Tax=Carnobacterium alterfunditum TaxID=28230 RepID=UPI003593E5EE
MLDEVAKFLKTTKRAYSNFENNLNEPDSEILNRLADYFDVTIDYLLGSNIMRKSAEIKHVEKN